MADSQVKIKLDDRGMKTIKRLPEIAADIEKRTRKVAAAAGPGMRSKVSQGRDRVRGTVWTGTYAAKKAEAEDRALTRALDAAR